MTTGVKIVELSSIASGTGMDHLLAITLGDGGGTIIIGATTLGANGELMLNSERFMGLILALTPEEWIQEVTSLVNSFVLRSEFEGGATETMSWDDPGDSQTVTMVVESGLITSLTKE